MFDAHLDELVLLHRCEGAGRLEKGQAADIFRKDRRDSSARTERRGASLTEVFTAQP